MSIAVPVILAILLSSQIYNFYTGLPNSRSEQKDKSEQADESSEKDKSENAEKSSSEKDKAGKVDKSSSATASKGRRHRQTERQD